VTVTRTDDQQYWVKMYNLTSETHELVFKEVVGGKEDSFIKLKEVEQNSDGS
jgi:hypothetical protein